MTNLFSKSPWLVFLQVVTCFGLPWSNIEPGPCTTKFVVVDDVKKNDLNIPYDIYRVERTTCFVSNTTNQLCDGEPVQGAQAIQEAQFIDKNGKVNHVSYDNQNFSVSLKGEDFTAQGIYNYSVSYYYETICNDEDNDIIPPAPTFCSGWINLSLIIVVTDVRLAVVSNEMLESKEAMTQNKFQVMEGASAVELECSLGLPRQLLNMQLEFVFTSAHSNAGRKVSCNSESNQKVDNWVVTPNMKDNTCNLKIMNFSEADDGQYDCLVILINSHTPYNEDRSNVVELAAESTLKPSKKQNSNKNDFGHLETGLFYVILSLMIATVLPCSVILIAVVIVKIRKKRREPAPERVHLLTDPHPAETYYDSTTQCHRGTGGEIINLGPDTPYHTESENELETSFSSRSGRDTDSSPTNQLFTTGSQRATSSSIIDETLIENRKLKSSFKRPSYRRPLRPRSSYTRSLRTRFSHRRKRKTSRNFKSGSQASDGGLNVMSESIIDDRSAVAMEYKNKVSARIQSSLEHCQHLLVGFKENSRERPHKQSQTQGSCDSGSRPYDHYQPSLPDPLEGQDQIEAGDTISVHMYRIIPSDTSASGPATSEASSGPSSTDLSSGKSSPESHYQLEQRDDSCSGNERNDSM